MVKVFPAGTRDRFIDLVCDGASFQAAAAVVGASHQSGGRWWRQSGRMELESTFGRSGGLVAGVPVGDPTVRAVRRRPLTSEERHSIQTGLRLAHSPAEIARAIGRDRSVVWREIARNSSEDGEYRDGVAHRVAAGRRCRPKALKLLASPGLCSKITGWMDDGWSPGLIAEVLAKGHGPDQTGRVSHETIYRALYVQTRGALRADLHRCLSTKRPRRVRRGADRKAQSPYKNAFKISDRPAEAADRVVPGHWEGDLIMGTTASGSAVGTLVERTTRFTILLHLPGRHDADSVAAAMIAQMGRLPEHLRRSLTWDRGTELAEYADIQLDLKMPVFFCDPHSPWQRGTNENTNRLLRFWLEKSTDLSIHTADDLARIAATLNARPRPTLDLKTPAQALNEFLTQVA
jgi:IS30 family transposase